MECHLGDICYYNRIVPSNDTLGNRLWVFIRGLKSNLYNRVSRMPRPKGHPEFQHLDEVEYKRAVNRLNATKSYRRKQIANLKKKLAQLEPSEPPSQSV